ncbi:MAG: arsenate reductase ArsC [Candidatus Cloacimonetes bacterium]|nr:arsenate reductase ArsC [Candidatus Cloacimonadota bacterium]
MKKLLILCTGNSCRSQMAEAFFNRLEGFSAYSAGTQPREVVNNNAVAVMKEIGIDISSNFPKHVDEFLTETFDFVITVCDSAKESCPVFLGKVDMRIHNNFEDPEGQSIEKFREIRDKIKTFVDTFRR